MTLSFDETDISCLLWFIQRWNSKFLTADNLHQLIVLTVLLKVCNYGGDTEETMAVQSGTCFMCFMEHCSVEVRHCRTLTSQTTVLPYLALWLFRQTGMLFWWEDMWCNPASCWNASTWVTEESRLWCCCLNPVWIDTVWILLRGEVTWMTVAVVNGCE